MTERKTVNRIGRCLPRIGRFLSLSIALAGTISSPEALAGPEDPQDGGQWGAVLPWPHVAVSAANLPNGKILTYSGSERDTWPSTEQTWSAVWDPATGIHQEIFHSGHNMFCAHLAMMEDGRVFVNGGRNQTNSPWASIFDYQDGPNGGWTQIQNMASGGRWYPTTLALPNGSIFTAIGTASLPDNPETWDPVNGWQIKNGISFNAMVLNDYFTSGTHGESRWWPLLHLAPNGDIFHSGPTPKMHYIDTTGNGTYTQVGPMLSDWYHKHGTTIMYDEGKILTAGGWLSGNNSASTNRVFTVDLNGPAPVVTVMPVDTGNPLPTFTKSMHFARKYHNGVMAPTGEVYVIGGNTSGLKFNDTGSILPVEIWNPVSEEWRVGAAMSIPRNYHSVALLLTDARILSAGSGYCSNNATCNGASHKDGQVYSPPYLFDTFGNPAPRPSITSGPGFISGGQAFNVQATAGMQKFSLVKMSSTTHGINTDARFLNVPFTEVASGSYDLTTTANQNVLTPGYWMLFALDSNGVPSVAHVVRANSGSGLPWINTPADQSTAIGGSVNLQLIAGDGDGDPLTYSATGLPPGLNLNPTTGLISGVTTILGVYLVTATVNDFDEGTAVANFQWTVYDPATSCPDCLDFNVFSNSSYSSEDVAANVAVADAGATLVLTDNTWRKTDQTFNVTADTILDFDFQSTVEGEIHGIGFDENDQCCDTTTRVFQLYGTQTWGILGFDTYPGTSQTHYQIPVGQFYTGGAMNLVFVNDFDAGSGNESRFSNVQVISGSSGNLPPVISNPGNQTTELNGGVNLTVDATDVNPGDILSFSDVGLPPGLAINSSTGGIAGVATTLGTFNVTITVDDGNGGSDSASFAWVVCNPAVNCGLLDFLTVTTSSYSSEDAAANVLVADGGATLVLADNTWRRTDQTFDITVDTVLEFDFQSTVQGEIHGIGFDENNILNDANRIFQLYGTQTWGIGGFDTYTGAGQTHYSIPIGQYYTGSAMNLVFVNDYDAGSGNDSRFSNVRILDNGELVGLTDPIPAASGSSANLSVIPNEPNLLFNWNFGDGTGDTGFGPDSSVNHTYTTPGLYVVSVTVQDPGTGEESVYTFVQLIHAPLTANKPSISTSIALHPVQQQIWNVNPDNDSVTVIDMIANIVTAEIPVGDKPSSVAFAPDGNAWVINKGSATISIIDSASLSIIDTVVLDSASQPHGLAFSPTAAHAFVTLEATGDLVQLDATFRTELGRVYLGPDPRHLSVVADGSTVYVSRFITPRLPDEFTALPIVELGGQYYGAEVLVVDVATLLLDNTIILRWSDDLVSESQGPGLPNYLGPPAISPDDLGIWVPSKQDNILAGGVGGLRAGQGMTFDQTVRAVTSKIVRAIDDEDVVARIDHDNASVANYAAFGPYGAYLFTTLEGNREVAVSNAYTGIEIFRFDVGRAPQGVVVSSDGSTLYVYNFMDRSVGIYDISEITQRNVLAVNEIATVSTVTSEALSPPIFLGKQFFYDARDPRMSAGPYLSCAACHNDGGADKRIWDFTGVGEGLRNTTSLEGRAGTGHGFLHWSANFDEVQDFEAQIRFVSGGTGLMSDVDFFTGTRSQPLGDPKAGISPDLDALAAYVGSLSRAPDSPYRNSDGTLSAEAEVGKQVFEANACADCHTPTQYTDSTLPIINLHDVGTLTANSGSRLGGPLTGIDTPTLLGVWQTPPYLHDGSAFDLTEAIAAHTGISLTAQELDDLAFYLQELDYVTAGGCVSCLDFNVVSTSSYSSEDAAANVAVADAGATLVLTDNTWRRTDQSFNVTIDTVLDFDFQSTVQGEIHGIGFDENNILNDANRIFQLYGTQTWGILGFDTYTGAGQTHYLIPIGQYYTGNAMNLVFTNDYDAGIGNDSRFSNVRVLDVTIDNIPPTINSPGDQTTSLNGSVNLTVDATDLNPGDILSFSDVGLPPGLVINSSTGTIIGVATTLGTFNVTITVDDGNSGSDSATFDWTVCDPAVDCGFLDFNTLTTSSYGGEDAAGNVAVVDAGATLVLTDNTWRKTDQTFNVTADTILEFDFQSTTQGEIHGIGFDENDQCCDTLRVFQLFGTQGWGIPDYYTGGGLMHYLIPVGQHYTGAAMNLVFVNDYDAGIGNDSRFSNVRVYEDSP